MSKSSELYERDRIAVAKASKVRYNPMVIERGEGPRLIDADGRSYLDFGASWALTPKPHWHAWRLVLQLL